MGHGVYRLRRGGPSHLYAFSTLSFLEHYRHCIGYLGREQVGQLSATIFFPIRFTHQTILDIEPQTLSAAVHQPPAFPFFYHTNCRNTPFIDWAAWFMGKGRAHERPPPAPPVTPGRPESLIFLCHEAPESERGWEGSWLATTRAFWEGGNPPQTGRDGFQGPAGISCTKRRAPPPQSLGAYRTLSSYGPGCAWQDGERLGLPGIRGRESQWYSWLPDLLILPCSYSICGVYIGGEKTRSPPTY